MNTMEDSSVCFRFQILENIGQILCISWPRKSVLLNNSKNERKKNRYFEYIIFLPESEGYKNPMVNFHS